LRSENEKIKKGMDETVEKPYISNFDEEKVENPHEATWTKQVEASKAPSFFWTEFKTMFQNQMNDTTGHGIPKVCMLTNIIFKVTF
jgi:hypothetical protein